MAVTPLAAVLPAARPALIVIAHPAFGSWPAGSARNDAKGSSPGGTSGAAPATGCTGWSITHFA